jgi:hypothetical protein
MDGAQEREDQKEGTLEEVQEGDAFGVVNTSKRRSSKAI